MKEAFTFVVVYWNIQGVRDIQLVRVGDKLSLLLRIILYQKSKEKTKMWDFVSNNNTNCLKV